jgi:outer membrane assembly lipoprotein YfiO
MHNGRALSLAVVLGMALFAPAAAAQERTPPTVELKPDGRWQAVDAPTTAPVSEPTLDRVEEMLRNHQAASARGLAVSWVKNNKSHPLRDRAVFLLGQTNFELGGDRRINAFYNFEELLDYYPDSRYFYPALQRQYEIADAYLNGYKNSFLGLPIVNANSEATEMLYRIQQRAPGSPLAEKSLLRVADYFYADAQYDVAADAYAAYIRSYPRSPYLSRVRLRQAFSALAQFRGVKFDATPIIDARQQLVNLMDDYPQIAQEENIPALLRRIDEALAKKILTTAEFYSRTNKPRGAAHHYRYLIAKFPQSPEAEVARQRLAKMSPEVLTPTPLPNAGPSTTPATGTAPSTNRGGR